MSNTITIDEEVITIDVDQQFITKDYMVNPYVRELVEDTLVKNYSSQTIVVRSHDGANFNVTGIIDWLHRMQDGLEIPSEKIIFETTTPPTTNNSWQHNYAWRPVPLVAFQRANTINLDEIDRNLSGAKFVGMLNASRWAISRFRLMYSIDQAFPGDTWITHHAEISRHHLTSNLSRAIDAKWLEKEIEWINEKVFDNDTSDPHIMNSTEAYQGYPKIWNKYIVEVVAETDEYQNQWFTDKIAKCLATGKPFVLLSGKHSLKNLKRMGFKSFDQCIDESYDECTLTRQRINAMVKSLSDLYQDPDKKGKLKRMIAIAEENMQLYQEYLKTDTYVYPQI